MDVMKQKSLSLTARAILLLCLVSQLLVIGVSAAAEQNSSLTVEYVHSGVVFSVYHVAAMKDGGYGPTADFSGYPISWETKTTADRKALATTLASYVYLDAIPPTASGETENGRIVFENLADGLYLILGESYEIDASTYTPIPLLACLSTGESVSVVGKYDQFSPNEVPFADFTVKKIWKDENASRYRSDTITVQLFKNSKPYSKVVLHAKNNWSHTFEKCSTVDHWTVAEVDCPDGYQVSITQDGFVFTITNTLFPKPTEPAVRPDPPGTGDDAAPVPYLLAFLASLFLLIFLISAFFRKHKS